MTPDGISTEDWDKVTELAANIANAACADDQILFSKHVEELLSYLETLQVKYGDLPSILATRADYVEDISERLALLQRAYTIAQQHGDNINLTSIASSLTQLYIDELRDSVNGAHWLSVLKACLTKYPNEGEMAELNRLTQHLLALLGHGTADETI